MSLHTNTSRFFTIIFSDASCVNGYAITLTSNLILCICVICLPITHRFKCIRFSFHLLGIILEEKKSRYSVFFAFQITVTLTYMTPSINDLPNEIISQIFFYCDGILSELLAISLTCRRWRAIIADEWFLQQRFARLYRRHLIGHWEFEDGSKLGHDSSGVTKDDRFSLTGQPQQDTCFLGPCLLLNGRSSINIPVHDIQRYQTDTFCVSAWLMDTYLGGTSWRTAVGSWEHNYNAWLHLGVNLRAVLENQVMISTGSVHFFCGARDRMTKNTWYHIVALVSRNKQQLFVNGELECNVDMSRRDGGAIDMHHLYRHDEKWEDQHMQMPRTLHIGVKTPMQNFWHGGIADVAILIDGLNRPRFDASGRAEYYCPNWKIWVDIL